MQKIDKINDMRAAAAALRSAGRRVALIPTAGALHAGHASLIRLARETGAAVVVSTFIALNSPSVLNMFGNLVLSVFLAAVTSGKAKAGTAGFGAGGVGFC